MIKHIIKHNKDIIKEHISKTKFPDPINYKKKNIKTSSWFDIKKLQFKENNTSFNNLQFSLDGNILQLADDNLYKGKMVQIFPDIYQQQILLKWIESYRLMMNATICLFKQYTFNKTIIKPDFKNIRTNLLKAQKEHIYKNSFLANNEKTKIYSHSLDYAIKDVCTNMKSMITNLKNKNISSFRLRYIKKTKDSKLVKLEKTTLKADNYFIINKILGKIKCDEIIPKINCDCSIITKNKRFFIIIPVKLETEETDKKRTIGIDIGIRTFLTGYNGNGITEICNNLQKKHIPILKEIDEIQSRYDQKIILNKKGIEKRRRKIKNLIDDMHWKSINYLTENFDNIILGNISTKNIVSNTKKLGALNKRIGMAMQLYKFKERLKYKCNLKGKKVSIVNESYTSKICSSCGNLNKEKNETKKYKCEKCEKEYDRDHNGAKNIYILGTIY